MLNIMNLQEGIDYYVDSDTGWSVWTEKFLIERGFCCNSDCRHCPYDGKGNLKVKCYQQVTILTGE